MVTVQPSAGVSGIQTQLNSGNDVTLVAGIYAGNASLTIPANRQVVGVHDADDPLNDDTNSILNFSALTERTIRPRANAQLRNVSICGYAKIAIDDSGVTLGPLYLTQRTINGDDPDFGVGYGALSAAVDINDSGTTVQNVTLNYVVVDHVMGHGIYNSRGYILNCNYNYCKVRYAGDAYRLTGGSGGWPWDGTGFCLSEWSYSRDCTWDHCTAEYCLISGFHQEPAGMRSNDQYNDCQNLRLLNCAANYCDTKSLMWPGYEYEYADDDKGVFASYFLCNNVTAQDCTCTGGFRGFETKWASAITLRRCKCYNNRGNDFAFWCNCGFYDPMTMIDCESHDCAKAALNLHGVGNMTVTNLQIDGCQGSASGFQIIQYSDDDVPFGENELGCPNNSVDCDIVGGASKIALNEGSSLTVSGTASGTYDESPWDGTINHTNFSFGEAPVDNPEISIERKAGAGEYAEVYTGEWIEGAWTDEGPFDPGETYTYRCRKYENEAYSDYSNEEAVTYSSGGAVQKVRIQIIG